MENPGLSNLLIVTIGSRGDIQPYCAFANELISSKRYRVGIASVAEFEEFVMESIEDKSKFKFYGLKGNPTKLLSSEEFKNAFYKGGMMDQMRVMMAGNQDLIDSYPLIYAAAKDLNADAIFSGIINYSECLAIGQKEGIPIYIISTIPFAPTSEFPLVTIKPTSLPFGFLNKLTYSVGKIGINKYFGPHINKFRTDTIGLPPMNGIEFEQLKMFCIYSPLLLPKSSDWSEKIEVTGFWVLKSLENQKLDDKIIRFLEAGSPPVYMGFGSMPVWDMKGMVETFAQVLKKLGLRGIYCGGWNELQDLEIDQELLLIIKGAPHELLLPRCLMAIHHGGAGTTAAVCRAGIPNIIFPVLGDQPFWAHRIGLLGVGPSQIFTIKQINADTLETQILSCLNDKAERATALGKKMREEDGLLNCMKLFEADFSERRPKKRLEWQSNATTCTKCSAQFSFFSPSRNCHSCGKSFCPKCVTKRPLMNYIEPQDVCDGCKMERSL